MKKNLFGMVLVAAALSAAANSASAQDADVLSGDTRLACEAILCLSTGQRPSECTPSLDRYFGIKKKKLSDTLEARLDFLNKCPVANQTPQMSALVRAISRGAGRCDAASLNSTLQMWTGGDGGEIYISNRMPDHCAAYTGHAYTDFNVKEPTSETSARLTAEGHGVEGRVNQAAARMKPKRVSALIQRGALR
ncbi:TrbM/KikA/MpfK family conjugal transfer protein [Aromatoleum anaerobium]|uniref:Conjugal transfer protein TrbM n=1 Tax=Aromatoleum anaerobium TaxID=182180 RepID=A0ABX1PP27_9RHOO|nr:TrbM/KikA/MpfK family conjugal transfer protein [Aromatoleum anaerobium]MCK0505357.1 TrbM/KikA/MpfK family conjugal transfer protein [Aromatoleum anaerobium]